MTIANLNKAEYDDYFAYYIKLAPDGGIPEELEKSKQKTIAFFQSIPNDKWEYRYAEDKWTIKEVLQHLIDVERIFTYRALRFAREDSTPLPGFEVADFGTASRANNRSIANLLEEFTITRNSTQFLFNSFDEDMMKRIGIASGAPNSVRVLGLRVIGHDIHHCRVIEERYF